MPAIKKEQVLDDSVKKAFDDLNASVRLSVDLLVMMTKNAKAINDNLGAGSNVSQMSKATNEYNANLKEQAKAEQEVLKAQKLKLQLSEQVRKADEAALKAAKSKQDALDKEVTASKKATDEIAKSEAKAASIKAKADAQAIKDANNKAKADEKEAKAAKKKAEQTAKESTEYYKLSKAYREADKAAKEAGATFGRNSVQFKKAREEAKKLGDQFNGLNRDLGHNQDNVGNYSSAFKTLGAGLLGGFGITLGLTAVIGGIKSVVQNSMAFEKALSSLKAITGVSTKEMEFFRTKAIQMSKDSVLGATEIVKAFELVGSKSPELLKSKDALASVTEQAIILSEATGGSLGVADAALSVTAAMNQFGISAMEAGRITNVLAAGSKEGSAEVSSLTESLKNSGTVMKAANMTFEQGVGALELLGEKQIDGAEAGTKMAGAINRLQKASLGYKSGTFNLRDALIQANKEMVKFGTNMDKDAYITDVFGQENKTVGLILMQNIDKYDSYTKAVTGTTTALKQQKDQNDNLSSSIAKIGNAWDSWMLSLNKSSGVLKSTVDFLTGMINAFSFQTMDDAGKAAELASREFAKLNKELSALSIKDQIHAIEADLKTMNQTLKDAREKAANEGLNIESGIFDTKNFVLGIGGAVTGVKAVYSTLTKEELTSAKIRYNSQQVLAKQMQERLGMLYAEQMKQEDGIELTKEETDAIDEKNKSKDKEKKTTKDLIKLKEEEIQKAKDVDATNAHEIAVREQKVNKLEEELKALKKIQELAIAKPISIELEKVDFDDINTKALESAKEQTEIYKDELDQQIEDLMAAEEQKAEIRQQWADTVADGISEIESVVWDNVATSREDAMNAEIEAMQERLDNENLDEEQREAIQKDIDESEKQLKIKNAKAEKQEALMKIAVDTLMAVAKIKAEMAIWAAALNPVGVATAAMQIPFVIASGAMSAAAVSMRKIPEYAEGTDFHPGGYAVVGDGGKHELVETPSGARFVTPNTDTLINLERGSKVYSGDEVNERLTELTRNEIVNMSLPSSIDKYQHALINKMISEQMKTTKAVNSISIPKPLNIEKAIRFETFKQRLKN